MADFEVTEDLLNRVDHERERRIDVERRFWASRRPEKPEEPLGCIWTAFAAAVTAYFFGAVASCCIGIPISANMGEREGNALRWVLGITAALFGAIATLSSLMKGGKREAPRGESPVPAHLQPDYITGAIATDDEIARADRFRSALSEWEQDSWGGWQSLSGLEFEERFASLLRRAGWRVSQTKASGDGGVDLWCTDGKGHRAAIQCKWWSKPCGVKPIRELVGVLSAKDGYCRGIVICKSGFTKEAKEFAAGSRIVLWDSSVVLDLLKHNRVPHLG